MSTSQQTTPTTETWLEVTTDSGQIFHVPKPQTGEIAQLLEDRATIASSSAITGFQYAISLDGAVAIRQYERTNDPERLKRSQRRAIGELDGLED